MVRVPYEGQSVVELKNGRARALISPEHGARLLSFHVEGQEIITWPENSDFSQCAKVRGGNPILFPVCARHMHPETGALGKAMYPGLPCSPGGGLAYDLPMHGFARDSVFECVEETTTCVRMLLKSGESTMAVYPFAFAFMVTYSLAGNEEDQSADLGVEFRTLNLSETPMPYYAGHHFYFGVSHKERGDWSVEIPCASWGKQQADGSVAKLPVKPAPHLLSDPDLIDTFHLELSSTTPRLCHGPSAAYTTLDLASDTPWYSVTTWALTDTHDHYCVEPWLGLPNALHHGMGLRMLEPSVEEAATVTLRHVTAKQAIASPTPPAAAPAPPQASVKSFL